MLRLCPLSVLCINTFSPIQRQGFWGAPSEVPHVTGRLGRPLVVVLISLQEFKDGSGGACLSLGLKRQAIRSLLEQDQPGPHSGSRLQNNRGGGRISKREEEDGKGEKGQKEISINERRILKISYVEARLKISVN